MSEAYLFATNKSLDQDTIVWTNTISPSNTLNFSSASLTESLNETYATAIEGNDSEYLSVLESTSDVTLEDLNNLTLGNSKVEDSNVELNIEESAEVCDLSIGDNADQVVVFTVDGSDELYGIQIMQDDQGNSQKYQFKFRQTEGGQLEAIPETIHLLPNEEELTADEQQELFQTQEMVVNDTHEFRREQDTETHSAIHTENMVENEEEFSIFVKGEPSEQGINEEESLQHEVEIENEDLDVKPAVIELQQTVSNLKSELLLEDTTEAHEIYQQVQHQTHVVYQEETAQVIYNQDEELFHPEEAEREIYTQENENRVKTPDVQTEETLVQEDTNFYEENIEEVQTFETIQFRNNRMVLETQYIPEIEDNEETDTDEEYPQYGRLYVQNNDDQNAEENEEPNLNIEERSDKTHEEYNHTEDNENEGFQVVGEVHVTAEEQILEHSFQKAPLVNTSPPTVIKRPAQNCSSNVLKQQSVVNATRVPKKSKKFLCYVVQHLEKENVNSVVPTMVPKNYKTNPRSVLKQSAIDVSLSAATAQEAQLRQKDQQFLEKAKLERRFAKNKDAIQAKLFNSFLSKTTIPHAPVRQKRLPRKQEIKPVDTRTEEEIIVQEVMVSSNGFIESIEDRHKAKDKLEVVGYIDVSDSEDENLKSSQKNDSVIEILSSEEESERSESTNKPSETPKKRRGRPKKNQENANSPQKEIESNKRNDEALNSADESSPSKKTRTDTSETESDSPKKEVSCPLCPKTFPSPNSLSTHIQHHKLENRMRKSRPNTFEFKHKCPDCEKTFKNSLLLSRHICSKNDKKNNNFHQCDDCKKTFENELLFKNHKKTHEASGSSKTCTRPSSVTKRLTLVPKIIVEKCSKGTDSESKPPKVAGWRNTTSKPSTLPKRQTLLPRENTDFANKYKCDKCDHSFKNSILLRKHICNTEKSNQYRCGLCSLLFKDISVLNIHKKKHIKKQLITSTCEVKISPMKFLPTGKRNSKNSLRQSLGHLKEINKSSPSFKVLKKFPCNSCSAKFTSRVLVDIHTRKHCVKTPVNKKLSGRFSLGKSMTTPILTKMNSSTLDMHAQCDSCSKSFKTYRILLKHQVTEHGYSPPEKDELMRPKKKVLVKTREHTGIPANPRLQKSFASLMTKLQYVTPKKGDSQPTNI